MNPYHPAWTAFAACQSDPDSWFPEAGGDWKAPARVCNTSCTVRLLCLDKAMRDEQGTSRYRREGIMGGLTPAARAKHEPQWLAEQAAEVAA